MSRRSFSQRLEPILSRIEYLKKRIERIESETGKTAQYDRAELSALEWAVDQLRAQKTEKDRVNSL